MDRGWLRRVLRFGFRHQEPRLQIDWMTHTDEHILEILADAEAPMDTGTLANHVDRSDPYVADRCRRLSDRGLLAETGDGHHRITDRGIGYLTGSVPPAELTDATG